MHDMIELMNKVGLWLIVSLIFCWVYRLFYNRYMNKVLEGNTPRWKLPSIRSVVVAYVLVTFTLLITNLWSQNEKVCENDGYLNSEFSHFDDEASYREILDEFIELSEEGEQLNVSYKEISENAQLVFSQNKNGEVLVALRFQRDKGTSEKEYYHVRVSSNGASGSSTIENTGNVLGGSVRTTIPEENCSYYDIKIIVYNLTSGENVEPILIEENIRVDKVVSLR